MIEDHIALKKWSLHAAKIAAALTLSLLSTNSASAQDTDWQLMTEERTGLEASVSRVATIWNDVLQNEASVIRDGGGQIFIRGKATKLPANGFRPTTFVVSQLETKSSAVYVSMMLQRPPACDNGANGGSASSVEYSRCPLRVSTFAKDGSLLKTVEAADACIIVPSMLESSDKSTGSFVRLVDSQLELKASIAGKDIPGCTIAVPLR